MWVDVNVALDTFLSHVGPGVPAHPLPLTLGTLVLPETPLLPLVRRQALSFGSGLRAVFDIMALVEAEVAQVVGWRPLVWLSGLRGKGEV